MATLVWPSTPVVKCSVALAGIVELRWMIRATTPPSASMPSESGVTSSSSRSSSASLDGAGQDVGLHRRAQRHHFVGVQLGVRLLAARAQAEELVDQARTAGMRVDPPTSTTSSICSAVRCVLHRLHAGPRGAIRIVCAISCSN